MSHLLRQPWQRKTKTHNSSGAEAVKLNLRRHVLAEVRPARVLDAFCGPDGLMWSEAWRAAEHYAGIDRAWKQTDERRRFVGDNLVVLRAIDLGAFNVFDLDAFGSPWEAACIVAARRTWAQGERGALVLTDGARAKAQFGGTTKGLAELTGMRLGIPVSTPYESLRRIALQAWAERAGVRILSAQESALGVAARGAKGSFEMVYSAAVFEGARSR